MANLSTLPITLVARIKSGTVATDTTYTNPSSIYNGYGYTFTATLEIVPTITSDDRITPNTYTYDANQVVAGMWFGQSNGFSYEIISVSSPTSSTEIDVVLKDVGLYNLLSDSSTSGFNTPIEGNYGLLFNLSDDGDPVLSSVELIRSVLPDINYWVNDLYARFQYRNLIASYYNNDENNLVYSSGYTVGQLVYLDAGGQFQIVDDTNQSQLEKAFGIITSVNEPEDGNMTVRPFGKITGGLNLSGVGTIGDVLYYDMGGAGSNYVTAAKPTSNPLAVYIKINDTTASLIGWPLSPGGTGGGGTGSSGTSGDSGSSGTSGDAGSSGTSGSDGASGADGSSGTSGESGTSGISGVNGVDGTSGSDGASGADGSSGTSGSDGAAGADGSSGTSGDTGSSGTSGDGGSSGTSGMDGTSGVSGVNGVDGTSGQDGTSGSSGQGFQWMGVWDGSPITGSTISYGFNDVVYYNGTTYIFTNVTPSGIGSNPPDSNPDWATMSISGSSGTSGGSSTSGGTAVTGVTLTNTVLEIQNSDSSTVQVDFDPASDAQTKEGVTTHGFIFLDENNFTGDTFNSIFTTSSKTDSIQVKELQVTDFTAKLTYVVLDVVNTGSTENYILVLPPFVSANDESRVIKFVTKRNNLDNLNDLMVGSKWNSGGTQDRIIAANINTKVTNDGYFFPLETLESVELLYDGYDWLVVNTQKQQYVQATPVNYLLFGTNGTAGSFKNRDINNLL